MEIHEAEEKLENMHFDNIVKSYCYKVNYIENIKAENKELKEQLRLHSVSNRRELFVKEQGKWLMENTSLSVEQVIDFEMEFINK